MSALTQCPGVGSPLDLDAVDDGEVAGHAAVADGEAAAARVDELRTLAAGQRLLRLTQVVLLGDVVRLPAVQHLILLALAEADTRLCGSDGVTRGQTGVKRGQTGTGEVRRGQNGVTLGSDWG